MTLRLHPEARVLLAAFESLGDPPIATSTPEAVRALRASRIPAPTVELAEIRDVDAGGVPARLYRPSAEEGLGLFLYLHGGGWVLGSVDTHDHVARALSAESGCAVLSLDYRLAPEHPFPAGLDDAFAAATWAHRHAEALGCERERLAIGGSMPTGFDDLFAYLLRLETEGGEALDDEAVRDKLADWYVRTAGLRYTTYRTLTALAKGQMPGPENSIGKVVAGNTMQEIASFALELQEQGGILAEDGGDAAGRVAPGSDTLASTVSGGGSAVPASVEAQLPRARGRSVKASCLDVMVSFPGR